MAEKQEPSSALNADLQRHQSIKRLGPKHFKNIEESITDICDIEESDHFPDKCNLNILQETSNILKKDEKPTSKNELTPSFLMIPQEMKPMKPSGSCKNLFQKQLSMDIVEESSFLLTIPKYSDSNLRYKTQDESISVEIEDNDKSSNKVDLIL